MIVSHNPEQDLFSSNDLELKKFDSATKIAYECASLMDQGHAALDEGDEEKAISFCSYTREKFPFMLGNLGFTSSKELLETYQSEFGLESFTPSSIRAVPFTGCQVSLESLDEIIINIIKKIKNFIVYVIKKIGSFISNVIQSLKFITSGAEELKSKLVDINKEKTLSKKIEGIYAEKLVSNLESKFPNLKYLASSDIVNSPGIGSIGRNILMLGAKETKLDYPFLGDLPIGDKKAFASTMIKFYQDADINSTGKVTKDSKCIEENVLKSLKFSNGESVVRVYNADMRHIYYVALTQKDDDPLRSKFGKISYKDLKQPTPNLVEITSSKVNDIFGGDVYHFTYEALDVVIKNTDNAIRAIRMIPDKVNKLKRELDKVLENRSVVRGEKEIGRNLSIYSAFCNSLFTSYFNDSIKSAIGVYSDIYSLCKMLFSALISETQK